MTPCDPCAWSKMIGSKQMTPMFHAEDLMISRVKNTMVIEHIKLLDPAYGEKSLSTFTRGKAHEHMGVAIDFSISRG